MSISSHYDTIRCKHCDAVIALLLRSLLRDKFNLECWACHRMTIVWPAARQAEPVYTMADLGVLR